MVLNGKWVAVLGLVLQLGAVSGLCFSLVALIPVLEDVGSVEVLAEEISQVLGPVAIGAVLGMFGMIMFFVTLYKTTYRSLWFYRTLWVVSVFWLINFPIGTLVGILLMIYLVKHKYDFVEKSTPGHLL